MTNPETDIVTLAHTQIRAEIRERAVAAEVLRIRAEMAHRSPWLRFLAWLPFTITWKT